MRAGMTTRSHQDRRIWSRAAQRDHAEDVSNKRIWSSLDDSTVHESEPDDESLLAQRTPKRRRTTSYTGTCGLNLYYSVPTSPTDRANLRIIQGTELDLVKVDRRLTEIIELREWAEAFRSDDESTIGDDDLARMADWDAAQELPDDKPTTQYGEEGTEEAEQRDTYDDGNAEEQRDTHDEVPSSATTEVHVVQMHHSSPR